MARYQIGDRVTAFNPRSMTRPRNGQIVEIRRDGDPTGTESTYIFRNDAGTGALVRRYEISDRQVIVVLERAQGIQDPIPPAPVPVAMPAPHPEPEDDDDDEEQTEAVPRPADEPQVRFVNPGIDWGAAANDIWGNVQQNARDRHAELLADARAHIEAYHVNGIAPLDFIVVHDIARPVFRSQDFTRVIQIHDYDGRTDRERYYTYNLGDIVLYPVYDRFSNRIDYYDNITGEYYTNQYRNNAVTQQGDNRIRDNIGIQWCRTRTLTAAVIGRAIDPSLLKKKRKLRRKYKEMPKIREEKHYAGQEFIA